MDKQFELLTIIRKNILQEIEACSDEQLVTIPAGFNNHILWNAVHVIVSQQILLYSHTNTPFRVDQAIIDRYRRGTTPGSELDKEMIDFVKNNLLATVAIVKGDYQNNAFGHYQPTVTSFGATLNTLEDAITFNNLHESMHYGQIKMLRKLVE